MRIGCDPGGVLVVEDEESVRDALTRALTRAGLTVHTAADGLQALAWLQQTRGTCDLVLCDQGMVGMTGLEMLTEIRRLYPRMRRVLLSGWGAEPPGGV